MSAAAMFAAERVMPYQSASTRQDLEARTYEYNLLDGPAREPVEILFRDAEGRTFRKTLRRLTAKVPKPTRRTSSSASARTSTG